MNILLIQPPIEDFFTTPIRLYPLGLLYAAATLHKLGCDVRILDCLTPPKKRQLPIPKDFDYLEHFFKNDPLLFKGYYRFGLSDEMIVERIKNAQPDLIGISSQFTAYFSNTKKLAELIKNNMDVPIFIGGNHATAFGEQIKQRTTAIDDVLIGPAEQALPKYLSRIDPSRFTSESIDWKSIRPMHSLLHGDHYRMGKKNYISLSASRGCPHTCEFCSVHNMFGRRMDYRDIDDIINEMHQIYIDKDVRIFNFEDDNISANKNWFTLFLERLISDPVLKNIEVTALNGLCYTSLDESLLKLMSRAGFRKLHLSYVTHDHELRQQLKRPFDKNNLETLAAAAHKLNIFVTIYVIIGLPGQSFDQVKKSIDYLLSLNVLVGPSVFYMPPASALYEHLDIHEDIRNNWNLHRSSAFAVETDKLNRKQLVQLFSYTRRQNLLRKQKSGEQNEHRN